MGNKQSERRRSRRVDMACPVKIATIEGEYHSAGKTINISDGGLMMSTPVKSLPNVMDDIHVTVSIPRTTANTHMFEEIASPAAVIRHQPMLDADQAAIAIRFHETLDLTLEV